MKYAALIFDIVESRHYQDRYDVQNILMDCVEYLNKLYKEEIKKDVVSSAGDEFQGLFFNLQSAFLYIRKLQLLIYPIKVRCGIGYGEIKYDVGKWSSLSMDGEAYYLARDAINEVSKKRSNTIFFNTGSSYNRYLNALCLSSVVMKMNQSQVARWIEFLADIVLPLKDVTEDISFYRVILQTRQKIIESERWNKVYGKPRDVEPFEADFYFLLKSKDEFYVKKNCNRLSFEEFWNHGMSTALAQTMNTSRQNIDRYVSLGKIKESRTIDKAIYELLGEKIW